MKPIIKNINTRFENIKIYIAIFSIYKKILALFFIFIFYLFFANPAHAQLLLPQDAFKFQAFKVKGGIEVNFKIAKNHILYKEKFEFFVDDRNTKVGSPIFPTPKVKYDANFNKNVEYYAKQAKIFLPLIAVKDPFTLKVIAQGCSENGICYPPSSYYYHVIPTVQSNILKYAPIEQKHTNPRNSQAYGYAFSFMKNQEYKSAGLETVPAYNQNKTDNQIIIQSTQNNTNQKNNNSSNNQQEPQQDHSKFYWLFIFMCIICTAIISHPSFNKEE